MTERVRAVLDTNILLSAALSKSSTSPSRELILLLGDGAFEAVTCVALIDELIEKLAERHLDDDVTTAFIANALAHMDIVHVLPATVQAYVVADPDDDVVVACARLGGANVIATYDHHFDALKKTLTGIRIMTGLELLQIVRGPRGDVEG